jgi:hypothetical protein
LETTTVATVATLVTKVRLVAVAVEVQHRLFRSTNLPTELLPPVVVVVLVPASIAGVLSETVFQVLPELLPVVPVVPGEAATELVPELVAVAYSVEVVAGSRDTTGLKGRKPNGMVPVATQEHLADLLDQLLPTTCLEQPGTVR